MIAFLMVLTILAILVAAFAHAAQKTSVHNVSEIAVPDGNIPGELGRFISLLNSVNSEKDDRYVAGLARLKENKAAVLEDARRLLAQPGEGLFATRHSTVLTVAALRDPSAIDILKDVALSPRSLRPQHGSTRYVGSELQIEEITQNTIVALSAVDGIEMLADDGHAAAIDVLVGAASLDSNAIRGAALTALAARSERRDHFERASAALPSTLRALAGLRRTQVHNVPQIQDPRVHLAGEEQMIAGAPILPEHGGSQLTREPLGVAGSPLVRRR